MRIQKGAITKLILEKLAESGELMLEAMIPRNRVESRMWREIFGLPTSYEFSKENFSAVLSRLKSQCLVYKSGGRRYAKWLLTISGKNKLSSYKIDTIKPDGIPRLVMYDIPEKERGKRDLLRCELVSCNYKQLQRSVWLGYSPLPEKFIQNIKDFGLKNKVHIVSINKTGTLSEF